MKLFAVLSVILLAQTGWAQNIEPNAPPAVAESNSLNSGEPIPILPLDEKSYQMLSEMREKNNQTPFPPFPDNCPSRQAYSNGKCYSYTEGRDENSDFRIADDYEMRCKMFRDARIGASGNMVSKAMDDVVVKFVLNADRNTVDANRTHIQFEGQDITVGDERTLSDCVQIRGPSLPKCSSSDSVMACMAKTAKITPKKFSKPRGPLGVPLPHADSPVGVEFKWVF